SKAAVTWPCSAPWRTNATSPRAPSARAKASSKMDLPAPVSPVSTESPEVNSISSRSMRIMSRIESRASMTTVLAFRRAADAEAYRLPVAARPQSKDETCVRALHRYRSGTRARANCALQAPQVGWSRLAVSSPDTRYGESDFDAMI